MKNYLRLAYVITFSFVILLVIHYKSHSKDEGHVVSSRRIRDDFRRVDDPHWLDLNTSFGLGIFRGVTQLQIEQAMDQRRIPPLRPEFVDPSQFSGPSKSIIVFSTWRTGSSFLGDLLSSIPGTFYSFEPLHFVDREAHINSGPKVGKSIDLIKTLLSCNFPRDYLTHINGGQNNSAVFLSNNKRIWEACSHDRSLCNQTDFVRKLCVHFPIHVVKTVRLRLSYSQILIDRIKNNTFKFIFLVRDPRGIMASRKNLAWCQDPSCKDPEVLCQDMMDDLNSFRLLKSKYPDQFYMLKHEELSFHPEEASKGLMDFVGVKFRNSAEIFIKTHTKSSSGTNVEDPYSTTRNSTDVPNEWKKKLSPKEILYIEKKCKGVMENLNYKPVSNNKRKIAKIL